MVFAMHHPFVQPHFVSTSPVDASEVQPAIAARCSMPRGSGFRRWYGLFRLLSRCGSCAGVPVSLGVSAYRARSRHMTVAHELLHIFQDSGQAIFGRIVSLKVLTRIAWP